MQKGNLKFGFMCALVLMAVSLESFAQGLPLQGRDRDMRPGRPIRRGNERSVRPDRNVGPGVLTYSGNGCPQNTMRVAFAPDNLSFSVLFDNFVAKTEAANPIQRSAISCDAVVPIQIPDNMQMEITRVDFRGFVALPANTRALLQSTFNFVGRGSDRDRLGLRYNFAGPVMDNYEISSDVLQPNERAQSTEISQCGGTVLLNIRSQLRLLANSQDATVTIDSIDGSANAVYYVNWRQCSPQRPIRR
jgi:hypothetical protein